MMGRLKILLSHSRNIEMVMNEKVIKYSIPIYTEKINMGNIHSIEIEDNEIVISFHTKKNEISVEEMPKQMGICTSVTPGIVHFD
jgi:hypothetical protein